MKNSEWMKSNIDLCPESPRVRSNGYLSLLQAPDPHFLLSLILLCTVYLSHCRFLWSRHLLRAG
ncbi:hypothetical protein BJX76DRAFT_343231 [Aspergillus varians]